MGTFEVTCNFTFKLHVTSNELAPGDPKIYLIYALYHN